MSDERESGLAGSIKRSEDLLSTVRGCPSCARKDAALRKILALHRSTQIGEGYSWQNENVCIECDGESWPCRTHKLARAALAEAAPAAGETKHQGCVTRLSSTCAYLADGTKITACRESRAQGRMWIEHHDQAHVSVDALPAPPAAPEPERWSGEVCKRCGHRNCVGFNVSDEIWARVSRGRWNILCPTCFDEEAQAAGVAYRFGTVYPVSWSDWRDPAPEPPPTFDAFLRSCAEDCVNAQHTTEEPKR